MSFPAISNLNLSLPARTDIRDILLYTYQQFGVRQQEIYYAALCHGLEKIATNPNLGHVRADLPEPYKAYMIRKHIAVYKVKHEAVYVARILHGSMNVPDHTLEDG